VLWRGKYDLRPLSDDLLAGDEGELLADILVESPLNDGY